MTDGESAFRDSGNCRLPEGISPPYPKDFSTNPSGRLRVLSAGSVSVWKMITTQIAKNPKKPQPVKQKIRYAKVVTVCIAAACQEDNEPRIVLCSDTRLDYQDLGSTNTTCKLDVLGHGWCVQMAGHWSGVREWARILKQRVQKASGTVDAPTMAENCRRSMAQFVKSPLYWNDQGYQLLVSGFDRDKPVIFKSGVFPQEVETDVNSDFGAIGEGEVIALTLLRQREFHDRVPLSYGAYLAYEAKRASERCGTVGHFTALAVQEPLREDDNERAGISVLNQKA